MAKTYIVKKDGEKLKELKTLPAAKKLADAEGAEVFCDGESVYVGSDHISGGDETVTTMAADATKLNPVVAAEAPVSYTLTAKMNIRKAPSMEAPKLGIAQAGAIVHATGIEGDWLHLTDSTFILYGAGKFAKRTA